jgi:hypothetical protein
MRFTKFILAALLFVSSVSFEQQVLVSQNGLESTWDASISTNAALALAMEAAQSSY